MISKRSPSCRERRYFMVDAATTGYQPLSLSRGNPPRSAMKLLRATSIICRYTPLFTCR
ncbi:Uncharacterised protein [Mycobacteroides abscessus]|nr:Uncharacterised protein [Mycobacteroides abscessus]